MSNFGIYINHLNLNTTYPVLLNLQTAFEPFLDKQHLNHDFHQNI